MGRSNGCEAARKRADAAKRAAKYSKEGNSQTAKNDAAMSLVCTQCMQSFMCTQRKMAEQHAESKHPKETILGCFPMIADMPEPKEKGKKKWEVYGEMKSENKIWEEIWEEYYVVWQTWYLRWDDIWEAIKKRRDAIQNNELRILLERLRRWFESLREVCLSERDRCQRMFSDVRRYGRCGSRCGWQEEGKEVNGLSERISTCSLIGEDCQFLSIVVRIWLMDDTDLTTTQIWLLMKR